MVDQTSIYSIKEITNYIKGIIASNQLLSNVWVRGEISNFTHHSSGHMYFTLKDESSRLSSIMFAGNNRFIKFIPKNGMKVIARGYVTVFERDGQYQLYIQEMQPDGIGQLYLAYEQLKQKLEQEGLFDQKNKKKLPSYPKTIGIVTSSTGAAIRDIITTIKRRYPIANLLIYPVQVQGVNAAKTIAYAIDQMNKVEAVDLLIVGRGGGSIEELWAFNEEIVARSISNSVLPIISAVGHETDFTIADFVADLRAATPTAAAEIAVPQIGEVQTSIEYLKYRLEKQIAKQADSGRNNLNKMLKSVVFKRPKHQLLENTQHLNRLEEKLRFALTKNQILHKEKLNTMYQQLLQQRPHDKIAIKKQVVNSLTKQLVSEISKITNINQQQVDLKIGKLDALSPLKVMQRGYALPYDEKQKRLIRSVKEVQLGDILKLKLTDGTLDCHIWSLKEDKNE